jgi:hypothetical protein
MNLESFYKYRLSKKVTEHFPLTGILCLKWEEKCLPYPH